MAGRNEEPGESVRVESLRAVSDCARSAAAMSSSATAVRAARMTERALHALWGVDEVRVERDGAVTLRSVGPLEREAQQLLEALRVAPALAVRHDRHR